MAKTKISIDFDSAITNIYRLGSGMVLSEPTVCAVSDDQKAEIKAIGKDAQKLIGKTAKNTKIIFPVFEGEIVNEKSASGILSGFLDKIKTSEGLIGSTALFALPCGYNAQMIEKYKKVAKQSGIGKVYFAESPLLSALGQNLSLNEFTPCFIIDMAGGTTSIAAVSLDGVITGISVNFGSNKVTADIIDYLADHFGLQVGLLTAERIKKEIGSLDSSDSLSTIVNGRDVATGTPRTISLKASDIFPPVKNYYDKIAEIALSVLKKLPPEVSADIRHSGIHLSGNASTIYGLDRYYEKELNMLVKIADNPLYSVALGGGIVLGDNRLLSKLTIKY